MPDGEFQKVPDELDDSTISEFEVKLIDLYNQYSSRGTRQLITTFH